MLDEDLLHYIMFLQSWGPLLVF